jgi:hypothetical protein
MRSAAVLFAALACALAGCGGEAGELITISTSGGGGGNHRLVVTGDGRGTCDGKNEQVLPSEHVIDAREVERELKGAAKDRASYTNGPKDARRYVVSTNDGLVTFTEGARGAPAVVAKTIVLTQELKRDLCPSEGG